MCCITPDNTNLCAALHQPLQIYLLRYIGSYETLWCITQKSLDIMAHMGAVVAHLGDVMAHI